MYRSRDCVFAQIKSKAKLRTRKPYVLSKKRRVCAFCTKTTIRLEVPFTSSDILCSFIEIEKKFTFSYVNRYYRLLAIRFI